MCIPQIDNETDYIQQHDMDVHYCGISVTAHNSHASEWHPIGPIIKIKDWQAGRQATIDG